jgi:hypothetical protein
MQQQNADANRSGFLDARDYVLLRKGMAAAVALGVPEPGTITLAIAALMIGLTDIRKTHPPPRCRHPRA